MKISVKPLHDEYMSSRIRMYTQYEYESAGTSTALELHPEQSRVISAPIRVLRGDKPTALNLQPNHPVTATPSPQGVRQPWIAYLLRPLNFTPPPPPPWSIFYP